MSNLKMPNNFENKSCPDCGSDDIEDDRANAYLGHDENFHCDWVCNECHDTWAVEYKPFKKNVQVEQSDSKCNNCGSSINLLLGSHINTDSGLICEDCE